MVSNYRMFLKMCLQGNGHKYIHKSMTNRPQFLKIKNSILSRILWKYIISLHKLFSIYILLYYNNILYNNNIYSEKKVINSILFIYFLLIYPFIAFNFLAA